jgi:hypothetical protein
MNVEIFSQNSVTEIEDSMNEWIEKNPNFEIITVVPYATMMHQLYYEREPTVCNQWTEYIWTVIYKTNK